MVSEIYELIIYLTEALISGIFITNILHAKYNKVTMLFLWIEMVLVAMIITPSYSLLRIAVIAFGEFLFSVYMYEEKLKEKIWCFIFKELILGLSSLTSYTVYASTVDTRIPFFAVCKSDDCTYCLLYLIIFSVLSSIAFQFAKYRRGLEKPWIIGTMITIGVGEVVASADIGGIDNSELRLAVISMVFMVTANISIGMLAPYLLRQLSDSNNIDYGKKLSNMEFRYYEKSVENDRKLNELRHDISNHIQTVYALIANGESQRGLEFIKEIQSRYEKVEHLVYCNNPVVNVILSNKKGEAENCGIKTSIKVRDNLDGIQISDYELSTVICNLLDNAIRGCCVSEQSSPRITVEILQKNKHLVIRVVNSCHPSMDVESTERIESTKSDSQTHGYGMPIISGIAKKYRGDFVVNAKNGLFTATVVMPLK